MLATLPTLTSGGRTIDLSPERFGWLRDSSDAVGDAAELRARMERDGYLFLPGFLDREGVRAARLALCARLEEEGLLDPAHPAEAAVAREGVRLAFRPDLANDGPARPILERAIYGERVMAFYSALLGGEARHFDYTWLRAVAPGPGTAPHTDVVFMGRGTKRLYTAWVPLGDVPLSVGGLILLEGSHRDEGLRRTYSSLDVDAACAAGGGSPLERAGFDGGGGIGQGLPALQARIGGRLLTCPEFRMGDLLTFSVYTVHGSLDNASREIRMSSYSRYQLASEPGDERWVGPNPPGHGGAMVRATIC